jgi:tripartite-type tricarboxylate transporter receptor subunit TctC
MSSAVAPEKYSELEIANCPLDMLIFNALFKGAEIMRRNFLRQAGSLVLSTAFPLKALAQSYPDRPIRLIVPLAPGGGGDIIGRLLATRLMPLLGQSVVVENRAGGATVIGTDLVARGTPDGYILVLATSSHVINGSMIKLPFDPVKDFSGVCLIATSPLTLAINPKKIPVNTLQQLVEFARTKPQGLTYGSSGLGGLPHLSGELLARVAKLPLVHVPYKGSGPAELDLLGGQIDLYFGSPSSLLPHVKSGSLRLLATTGLKRSPAFPDLPAVNELLPEFGGAETFYAVLAPANTPASTIEKLNSAIRQVLATPEVRERLADFGAEVVASAPADAMRYIDTQVRQWEKLVKEAGIKPG